MYKILYKVLDDPNGISFVNFLKVNPPETPAY